MRDLLEEFCNMWLFFLCICLNLQYLRITYIPYYKQECIISWMGNKRKTTPPHPHPPKNIIVYFKDQMLNLLELQ